MKVILFRHGEKQKIKGTDFTVVNSSLLTQRGEKQVTSLANYLHDTFPALCSLPVLYSSPLPRAVQSAKLVQAKLTIPKLVVEDSFYELYVTDDLSYMKNKNIIVKSLLEPTRAFGPKGSITQLVDRVLERIRAEERMGMEYMLISSHSILIRAISYAINPSLRPNAEKMKAGKLHNASFTVLSVSSETITVEDFNVYHFLTAELRNQMYNTQE